jgi:hypothetical protein
VYGYKVRSVATILGLGWNAETLLRRTRADTGRARVVDKDRRLAGGIVAGSQDDNIEWSLHTLIESIYIRGPRAGLLHDLCGGNLENIYSCSTTGDPPGADLLDQRNSTD